MAAKPMPHADYLRQALDYDPRTGLLLWRSRPRSHFPSKKGWVVFNATWPGKPFGCPVKTTTDVLYIRGHINGRGIFAHRLIYKMVTGNEPPDEVDHRDGDGLNNRWVNLRESTRGQNVCNMRDRRTSAIRGAFKRGPGWIARARLAGASHYFGTYDTPEKAHAAYVAGVKRLHAEFSYTERKRIDDSTRMA